MGVLLDLAYQRRWLMLGGVLLVLFAAFLPLGPVRDVLLAIGVVGLLIGLVVAAVQARRGRSRSH